MEPIIQQCFPDEALAAKELGFVSQKDDLLKVLQNNAATIKIRLDDSIMRKNDANQQFDRQNKERATLFNKFPQQERVQFQGTFDMIQQQVYYSLFLVILGFSFIV